MNVHRTDDQFLAGIQGAGYTPPLEDSWSLDGEPICYSEPTAATPPGAYAYSADGVCTEEIDPLAIAIATGSTEDSLRELGVADAETALRAYLSSGSEEQRQAALDTYYRIFETLYYLEQEYGNSVPGLREKIEELRAAIATRLVAIAGSSERGREFLAALVEQLAQLGKPVMTTPTPPTEPVQHHIETATREQIVEIIIEETSVQQPRQPEPQRIIDEPLPEEESSPLTFATATPHSESGATTAASRQPDRNIPYVGDQSGPIETEVEQISRESRARLPERRFERALQELRAQLAATRHLAIRQQ